MKLSSIRLVLLATLALATSTFAVDGLAAAATRVTSGGAKVSKSSVNKSKSRPGRRAATRKAVPPPIVIPLADAKAVASDPELVVREFDHWLDEVANAKAVAGLAVAIVKDDRVLLERGMGVTDSDTGEPVTVKTVFRLASLSKAFATAMTGLLVEKGRLNWDTRVADLLPAFTLSSEQAGSQVTVADILSHRVGLPHNTYDRLLEQDEPYELLVDRLKEIPLSCSVGECYGYQNIAFSLIGDVIFATTGDFYYHQVEKRLFHPLGMSTATYGREALESSASWARPHHRGNAGWSSFEPAEAYYRVAPAAGVNASIRDMEQWLIAQMGGRPDVLPASLLDTLHKPLVETARELRITPWRRGRLRDAQYALGWRVYDYAGETLVFHAGAVQGYRALIAFLPKYRFGMVMMWNCESAMPSGLMPMLMDRYLGLPSENWAGIEGQGGSDDVDVGSNN
ncbi:MAG: beta-lactamase family protein [Dokdonella sp.]|uniref:serine hydrolase domain-containing protein n=1 Tax=Dokdonella sp. TaxID=2291710 RepID=UPI0025C63059|nr:serine hydrolase domain-containing protein [Dokdonella sp.]MBZ0223520.1 beta-lactamase family protein [Dokdonella sp.]